MKRLALIFTALCVCLTISCNKEVADSQGEVTTPEATMQTITITASMADTKTAYTVDPSDDTKLKFSWTAGDQISVYCSDGNFYTFTANSSAATTTFTGAIPTGKTLGSPAFFPADAGHDLANYKYHIPESKDLTAHPSADIPMIGTKGSGNDYSFTHCCGATKLTVENIPDTFVALEISIKSPSLKLSGTFSVFTSEGFYRWNPAATDSDSEKTFTRKVAVSSHTASIYIPYASGSDWWGQNVVNVTGYDSSDTPTELITDKTMGSSIGTVARGHVLPLTPLGLNQLGYIDWSNVSIPTFAGNGTGHNYGERIIQWKAYKDSYYLYFWYKILKEKIKWPSSNTSYADSESRIYIGLDLDNDPTTGSSDSWADIPADGWESRIEVRPWSGAVKGSPEIVAGPNSSSWIEKPVGTTLGVKVSQYGTFDATYAYLQVSIPLSALGSVGATINARHGMQWGYYTSLESVSF